MNHKFQKFVLVLLTSAIAAGCSTGDSYVSSKFDDVGVEEAKATLSPSYPVPPYTHSTMFKHEEKEAYIMSITTKEEIGWFHTSSAPSSVALFYRDLLKGKGWTIDTDKVDDGSAHLVAKKEKETVDVSVQRVDAFANESKHEDEDEDDSENGSSLTPFVIKLNYTHPG